MGQHTRLDGGNTPAKLKRLKKFKNRNSVQGRKTLGKRTILSSRELLWDATEANDIVCVNNLRQMMVGIRMHVDDIENMRIS